MVGEWREETKETTEVKKRGTSWWKEKSERL